MIQKNDIFLQGCEGNILQLLKLPDGTVKVLVEGIRRVKILEFNDNHNTQYPSLLITPPNSVFPEVTLNNGWEEYSFEVYFSDLYGKIHIHFKKTRKFIFRIAHIFFL